MARILPIKTGTLVWRRWTRKLRIDFGGLSCCVLVRDSTSDVCCRPHRVSVSCRPLSTVVVLVLVSLVHLVSTRSCFARPQVLRSRRLIFPTPADYTAASNTNQKRPSGPTYIASCQLVLSSLPVRRITTSGQTLRTTAGRGRDNNRSRSHDRKRNAGHGKTMQCWSRDAGRSAATTDRGRRRKSMRRQHGPPPSLDQQLQSTIAFIGPPTIYDRLHWTPNNPRSPPR